MAPTPFESLSDYIALPRVEDLALSPDGRRVVLTVATLSEDRTSYERSLWSVAADGAPGSQRLTRSTKGESGAMFAASGDLLFISRRPDGPASDEDTRSQLWMLPATGGEARPVTRLSGGVTGIEATAETSDCVILTADLLRSAETIEQDSQLRGARKKAKVSAILHEGYPVRHWDADLGPDQSHVLALRLNELMEPVGAELPDETTLEHEAENPYPESLPRPRDLTPRVHHPSPNAGLAITRDGSTVVLAQAVANRYDERFRLVAIDVASGDLTALLDEEDVDFEMPATSHDGISVAFTRTVRCTPVAPTQQELWVARLERSADGPILLEARRVALEWDRWPTSIQFDTDDRALIVTADQDGRGPIFRVPLDGGAVQQLARDDFTYSNVHVDRATGDLVALRASWMRPPHPVRIARADGAITELDVPGGVPSVPARIEDVETTASDGSRVRGWLLLPETASPDSQAPLLLWIHGGPLNSWNAWSWRWNPQLAVARGYAVLLPDPALSTGYGLDFIARGWNAWGEAPYTDLMSITDTVVARPDIDETRTAAMGGSFGGYMANWVAGHTDRFRAIVTHASLWSLDQFAPTTDFSPYWTMLFTPEAMAVNSPHRFVANIRTPMLVVHGDRDYRVPIGEGLRLWSELNAHFAGPDGTLPHRFLYFPDENHWVLKPQHAVVWYETVFAFLAQHVLGEEWVRPANLG